MVCIDHTNLKLDRRNPPKEKNFKLVKIDFVSLIKLTNSVWSRLKTCIFSCRIFMNNIPLENVINTD